MAGGADGGNFGVGKIVNKAGEHPDRNMGHEPMADSDRAIGDPIHHSRDMLPAQAAPKTRPDRQALSPRALRPCQALRSRRDGRRAVRSPAGRCGLPCGAHGPSGGSAVRARRRRARRLHEPRRSRLDGPYRGPGPRVTDFRFRLPRGLLMAHTPKAGAYAWDDSPRTKRSRSKPRSPNRPSRSSPSSTKAASATTTSRPSPRAVAPAEGRCVRASRGRPWRLRRSPLNWRAYHTRLLARML